MPNDLEEGRVVAALVRLGHEYEPPLGWDARVLSSTVPPRRSWVRDVAWAIVAGVIGGALVVVAIAWHGGWL